MVVVPLLSKTTVPFPLMLDCELSVAAVSPKASVAFEATVNDPLSVPPGSSRARVPLETATVPDW